MKRTWRMLGLAAVFLALVLAISACGGGSSSSTTSTESETTGSESSTGESEPAGTGSEATGEPIPIGFIGSIGGEHASSLEFGITAIEAWTNHINETGGINGHPLKLYTEDDENDATKALQSAKEMVEQDHIVAFVGAYSTVDVNWEKYVAEKNIPVIGSATLDAPYATNPDFFPQSGGFPAYAYALISAAQKRGVKKMGIAVCAESPVCGLAGELVESIGNKVGMPGIQVFKVGSSEPSYNSMCTSAEQAGLEGMAMVTNIDTELRIAENCAQLGYEPSWVTLSLVLSTEKWAKQPELEGTFIAGIAPYEAKGEPPREERNEVFEAAGIPTEDALASAIWSSAEMFKLAAERAKIGPESTGEEVKKGLYTFKNETVNNLTPPLTFEPEVPSNFPCYWPIVWENGEYKQEGSSSKAACIPPAKWEEVLGALAG
jgi:branched-chain amino acid transport system substrate-binding protein